MLIFALNMPRMDKVEDTLILIAEITISPDQDSTTYYASTCRDMQIIAI